MLTPDGVPARRAVLLVLPDGANKHQQLAHRMWCAGAGRNRDPKCDPGLMALVAILGA